MAKRDLSVSWVHQLISKCSSFLLLASSNFMTVSVTSTHYSAINTIITQTEHPEILKAGGELDECCLWDLVAWFFHNWQIYVVWVNEVEAYSWRWVRFLHSPLKDNMISSALSNVPSSQQCNECNFEIPHTIKSKAPTTYSLIELPTSK